MGYDYNVKSPFSINLSSPLFSNTAYYIVLPAAAYGITSLVLNFISSNEKDSPPAMDEGFFTKPRLITLISFIAAFSTACFFAALKVSHVFENSLRIK